MLPLESIFKVIGKQKNTVQLFLHLELENFESNINKGIVLIFRYYNVENINYFEL